MLQPFGGTLQEPQASVLLVPADLVGTGGVLDVDADDLPGARHLPLQPDSQRVTGWMPDSSALVVPMLHDLAGDQFACSIDVLPVAGGEQRTVIEDGFDPVVSPDGSQIAFLREAAGGTSELWVATADGSEPRRVTISLTRPTWSPDGSLLLVMDDEGWFTVRLDGTGRTAIPPILQLDSGTIERCAEWHFLDTVTSWQPSPP